jgi:hypothetical protein
MKILRSNDSKCFYFESKYHFYKQKLLGYNIGKGIRQPHNKFPLPSGILVCSLEEEEVLCSTFGFILMSGNL